MDVVAAFTDDGIYKVLDPTRVAFMKLLEKRREEIESHPRQTFQFGSAPRHKLDVYYPDLKVVPTQGPQPVLFFVYGGAFVEGDRQIAKPYDLGYSNLGVFFAQRGLLTVIADYRLWPEVTFPTPPEDVRDALSWFLAHGPAVAAASNGQFPATADLSNIFVLAHSAGGNHLASLYLSPDVMSLDHPVRAATRGLVPQGGAFRFYFEPEPNGDPAVLEGYYGSRARTLENIPLELLKRAPDALIEGLPEWFVLASEREPPDVRASSDAFVQVLEERLGKKVRYDFMKGHNHISPHWALLSGEGEEWGEWVAAWVKEKAASL